jgi:glycerol-3-phosphate acyltransferase PlsY
VLAILYLPHAALPGVPLDPEIPRAWLTLACGFAVIVGHVYPVWFGFRGGKGVATMIGVVGALDPRLLLPVIGTWFVVLVLSGYVGLASMLAGAALILFVYVLEPGNTAVLCFSAAIEIFVVFTHRGNIARMRAGNEHRVQRLWLFRSRTA